MVTDQRRSNKWPTQKTIKQAIVQVVVEVAKAAVLAVSEEGRKTKYSSKASWCCNVMLAGCNVMLVEQLEDWLY